MKLEDQDNHEDWDKDKFWAEDKKMKLKMEMESNLL